MNRKEIANALLRNSRGFDKRMGTMFSADARPYATDVLGSKNMDTLLFNISVANGASLSLNLLSQADLSATALPTGLVSVNGDTTLAGYQAVLRYFSSNVARLALLNIQTGEASNNAPILASMTITPTRTNPFGASSSNKLIVQTLQTSADFQQNRVSVPLDVEIDTFTYVAFQTGVNGSGAAVTGSIAFLFGARHELRNAVMRAPAPQVTMRPGGRGPTTI